MWDGSPGNLLSTLVVRYAHDHRWATGQEDGCEACHVGTTCQKCQRPLRGLGKGICALVWFCWVWWWLRLQVAQLYNMWAPVQVSGFLNILPCPDLWVSYHAVFPNRTSWTRRWRNKKGRGRYRPRLPDVIEGLSWCIQDTWWKSHNISLPKKSGQMVRFDHPMNPHESSRFKLPRNAWRSGGRKSYAPTRLLVAGFRNLCHHWPLPSPSHQASPSWQQAGARVIPLDSTDVNLRHEYANYLVSLHLLQQGLGQKGWSRQWIREWPAPTFVPFHWDRRTQRVGHARVVRPGKAGKAKQAARHGSHFECKTACEIRIPTSYMKDCDIKIYEKTHPLAWLWNP